MHGTTDYRTTAIVSGRDLPALSGSHPESRVEDLTAPGAADTLRYRVHTSQRGLLVVANSHAPGWSASVNGAAAPIVRTNWLVQGVFVEAGTSEVELTYSAPGWRAGVAVTLMTAALLAGSVMVLRRRSPVHGRIR